ncbi:Aste57867_24418 [Aphanomyces stellatus]|uniref:Aste57867_24418 protein n=1 Tax=Aphanomyces stellatus TaxID=120398 RepID=A0A485LRG6_9STRA|nr:hypothetical protein As57867_024342 [Aphanomyces stellatus]VFU01058.1 Aste57867_24418 [Aphanomyces stellatus]
MLHRVLRSGGALRRSSAQSTRALPCSQQERTVASQSTHSDAAPSSAKLKRRALVDVTIDRFDVHGNGVGRDALTNAVCTVVGAIPGQQWKGRVVNDKCSPVRVVGMELLVQSTQYAKPPCPHFSDCGGCKTQHVPYPLQVEAKQATVDDLLAPLEVASAPVDAAPALFHYRNKTEFTVSAGRWLTAADKASADANDDDKSRRRSPFTIGFFPKSTGTNRKWDGRVVAIDRCLLQDERANRVLAALWTTLADTVAAYDHLQHTGALRNVVLRVGTTPTGATQLMVGLSTATVDGAASLQSVVPALLAALAPADAATLVSVVQFMDDEMQRRHPDESTTFAVLHGAPHVTDSILGRGFRVSLHSFFQPNTAAASVLYAHLVAMVADQPAPPVVWDLFCGVGSIGICLADHVAHVVGIDVVPAAIVDAAHNARANGVADKTTFVCADVLAPDFGAAVTLPHPDVVVVDPPRPGLSPPLVAFLATTVRPREIFYVSCNVVTQARDLAPLLGGGYAVVASQPVDMLPHTPHVENIVRLRRVDE